MISFVVRPILRIFVTKRRNLLISGITTTFALACIVFIPTNLCASCIFFVVMFKVMSECRYIGLCNDNRVANRTMLAFGFAFFSTCWGNCIINNFRMPERRNLLISGITTTYAFACIVFIPTNLCAGCLFSVVMLQIMPKCGNNGLCFQNCSAYRAMFSLRKSRGCACWINRIVYHFNVDAYIFLPFHVDVYVFGQSRCFQRFKRSAYRKLSV